MLLCDRQTFHEQELLSSLAFLGERPPLGSAALQEVASWGQTVQGPVAEGGHGQAQAWLPEAQGLHSQ